MLYPKKADGMVSERFAAGQPGPGGPLAGGGRHGRNPTPLKGVARRAIDDALG